MLRHVDTSIQTPTRSFCRLRTSRGYIEHAVSDITFVRLNVYAHALTELGKSRVNSEDTFTALRMVYEKCQGAFACTVMIAGFGILGFR